MDSYCYGMAWSKKGETSLYVHKDYELHFPTQDYYSYNYKNAYVIHADSY